MLFNRIKNILAHLLPGLLKYEAARKMPSLYQSLNVYRPVSAWLNLTDNCNMRCIMCNQWHEQKEGELTSEEWINVINQLKKLKISHVGIGGGEPLLFRELDAVIRRARKLGMTVSVTTSGFMLTERRLKELLDAGMTSIFVSVDGVGEDYEKIRGRKWDNILRALELIEIYKRQYPFKAKINFVLMKQTLSYYEPLQQLANRLNLPVSISLLDKESFLFKIDSNASQWIGKDQENQLRKLQLKILQEKRAHPHHLENSFADIGFFSEYFKDPHQKSIPCTASQTRIMINGKGDVMGGCWAMGDFGNVRNRSLTEIISSEKFRNYHKQMFLKNCPGCSCGYENNNYHSLKMQLKEMKFRLSAKRQLSV